MSLGAFSEFATSIACKMGVFSKSVTLKEFLPSDLRTGHQVRADHRVPQTKDAAADRAFLRDVLGFASVDAGHGWLIFALPSAEAAVHPAEENERPELYLMCDDLKAAKSRKPATAEAGRATLTSSCVAVLTADRVHAYTVGAFAGTHLQRHFLGNCAAQEAAHWLFQKKKLSIGARSPDKCQRLAIP